MQTGLDFRMLLVLFIDMFMDETRLDNGSILRIEDETVPLSGDLHMIRIIFTLLLPLDGNEAELRSYCGDCITRKRTFEKSAVHAHELDKIKDAIKNSFLSTNLPYMNTDKFVTRLKERTLREMKEEKKKEIRLKRVRQGMVNE